MFNGIIKKTGRIKKIQKIKNDCYLEVSSNMKFLKSEIGSSISCSGTCLTLDSKKKHSGKFYLSKETLNKTIFKYSKKGDIINLEKSMKYGDSISGHIVQGHVDTISLVNKISVVGKTWLINFKLPSIYKKYITNKGSIAINGVSLTIAKILTSGFQISAIPKTLKLTNIIYLKEEDLVNIEFDILGKYVKNFLRKYE